MNLMQPLRRSVYDERPARRRLALALLAKIARLRPAALGTPGWAWRVQALAAASDPETTEAVSEILALCPTRHVRPIPPREAALWAEARLERQKAA